MDRRQKAAVEVEQSRSVRIVFRTARHPLLSELQMLMFHLRDHDRASVRALPDKRGD